jgi:hypothetical protein
MGHQGLAAHIAMIPLPHLVLSATTVPHSVHDRTLGTNGQSP